MPDLVRVFRIIEYVGPRDKVEDLISRSVQGEKMLPGGLTLRAATLGLYPDILLEEDLHDRLGGEE